MSITPGTAVTALRAVQLPLRRFGPALRQTGGLGLASVAGAGLLYGELALARRAIPSRTQAPLADGDFGRAECTRLLRLTVLGDSSAAGVGCDTVDETPGALLAQALVDRGYRVHLEVLAVSGSLSADLAAQVSRALLSPPDLAVICIGANDVTHFIAPDVAAPLLGHAVRALREAGVAVLVATCPDLGSVRSVPQPLRRVGHHLCRRMTRAQTRAVSSAGGLPVDVGRALGRAFAREGRELFSQDRFHPSPLGYRALVDTLLEPMDTLLRAEA
jgi:lysophospholipase L1-like esterase